MAGVVPVQISDRQSDRHEQQPEGNGDRMPSEPALPSFVAHSGLLALAILVRLERLLAARRSAQPNRLICGGIIWLALPAKRCSFGSPRFQERLLAVLSIIAFKRHCASRQEI